MEEVQRNVGVRSDLLQEAQANYERELLAHAKDVEALNSNSREKEQLRTALEEARDRLAACVCRVFVVCLSVCVRALEGQRAQLVSLFSCVLQ